MLQVWIQQRGHALPTISLATTQLYFIYLLDSIATSFVLLYNPLATLSTFSLLSRSLILSPLHQHAARLGPATHRNKLNYVCRPLLVTSSDFIKQTKNKSFVMIARAAHEYISTNLQQNTPE